MRDELVMVVPREALFAHEPVFQGMRLDGSGYLAAAASEYLFMPRHRAESDERYKQIIPYVVIQAAPGPDCRFRYLMFQRASGGDPRLGRLYSVGLGGHVNSTDVIMPPLVRRPRPEARIASSGQEGTNAAITRRRHGLVIGPSGVMLPGRAAGHHLESSAGGLPVAQQRAPRRRLVRRVTLTTKLREALPPGVRQHDHPLFRGLRRELREEVVFPAGCALDFLGAINDESTPVGRVHFGLAFILRVPATPSLARRRRPRRPSGRSVVRRSLARGPLSRSKIRLRREPGSVQVGALFGLDEIMAYRQAMENWSVLLLDSGLLHRMGVASLGRGKDRGQGRDRGQS